MSWVDNLPSNLELLALLSVSSATVSNVAVAPPTVYDPVVAPAGLDRDEASKYRKEMMTARRARSAGMSSSSTRGAKLDSIGREDVLASIASLSDLANFFVLGFSGLLVGNSLAEFSRLVYAKGIENGNSFTTVTMEDYAPVFAVVFRDLINPCSSSGKPRANIGSRNHLARSLGCSTAKATRLMDCYADIAHVLMLAAQEVSTKLYVGLKKEAA